MATDPQLVRAVALIHALARNKRGVALKQFADRRGFNLRALYRDIRALERAGFPVRHEHGRFSLPEDWLPPASVGVSQDELVALFVARHVTPGLKATPIGRALDSLWTKLSTRGAQTRLVPEDDVPFGTRTFSAIDYGVHEGTISKLKGAIGARRAVWICYRTPAGVESERVIEPGYLHWESALESLYVPSWCRLRSAIRVFAVHRILAIDVMDERVASRAALARAALARAFRVWHRDQLEHVVIRFMPPVAGEIRERVWHPQQRIVDDREGAVYLHLDIAAPEELERWLMGFGALARVVEPTRLAALLQQRHQEAAALGAIEAASAVPRGGQRRPKPGVRKPRVARRAAI
jgi:predicted DNA-binding transcriptional regulator YafY